MDNNVIKVPYSFRKVVSLTGKTLTDEIVHAISFIKKVKNNAAEKIESYITNNNETSWVVSEYKRLCEELKSAADRADLDKLQVQVEIKKLLDKDPHVKNVSNNSTCTSDGPTSNK